MYDGIFFNLSIFYFHIKIGKGIGQKFNNIKCALSLNDGMRQGLCRVYKLTKNLG